MNRRTPAALALAAAILAAPHAGRTPPWPVTSAHAEDVSAKDAFEAAKELGTLEAWNAFLDRYPDGFFADLARAYVKRLAGGEAGEAKPADPAKAEPEKAAEEAAEETSTSTSQRAEIKLGPNVSLGGMRLMPDDSPWNQDISDAPVDPNSKKILARIGLDKPLHPDFGTEWEGAPIGIPYVVVSGKQKRVPVTFDPYADESDPGPYPIPPDAPIEGGPDGDGDRHVIVLDRDSWTLYEVFNSFPDGKGWKGEGGAIWNLNENQVRPAGWTSADAAGLPILPGLVRYDEVVEKGAIEHALRFTVAKTRRAYVPPASHWASEHTDADLPPMGMRLRLRADFDASELSKEAQVIVQALKTYGMFLADNGSDNFVSGAPDPRWNDDALRDLKRVTTADFEVIEMEGLVADKRKK